MVKWLAIPEATKKNVYEQIAEKKGTQLGTLEWPKYQAYRKEQIEKVPSLIQKGTQLLRKYVITEQGKSFLSGQFVTDGINI